MSLLKSKIAEANKSQEGAANIKNEFLEAAEISEAGMEGGGT